VPQPCPELLFVSGPQGGQRAVLLKTVSLAGRSEACDVHLAEEFASRQHLRFENTPDGCLVEVLSPHGVRINGKTYKPPKKILLDTGDRLVVGAATEMLFVAAGDDPAEALAAFRKAHPPPAKPRPEAKEGPPEPAAGPVPEPVRKEEPATAAPAPQEDEERQRALQHRAKVRKYAILGGVYAVVLVGMFFFLGSLKKGSTFGSGASGPPAVISESLIEKAVREPLVRGLSENLAAEELRQARAYFARRTDRFGYLHLQKCVKNFKLHLAHLKRPDFVDPDDSTRYGAAVEELIAKVKEVYREAWFREKARLWPDSNRKWEELRAILPDDPEWDTEAYKQVVANVMLHAAYTRSNMPKGR
jgi:hypothetical protein